MAPVKALQEARHLFRNSRWAALGTLDEDGLPHVSMAAYAAETDSASLLLHLSRLAEHTGNLLRTPSVSIAVSQVDDGREDPQTLARLTIKGCADVLRRESMDYAGARRNYLRVLPAASPLFEFPDFLLFRVSLIEARYVGGFARAFTFDGGHLVSSP